MKSDKIRHIARLITEDPDIFMEMGSSYGAVDVSKPMPLKPADINKEQNNISDEAPEDDLNKKVNDDKELEKQKEDQKRKAIEPQLKQLDRSMQKLNQGVVQGKQDTSNGDRRFKDLENEMTNLDTLIGGFEKQL